jgi:hypothetical protein
MKCIKENSMNNYALLFNIGLLNLYPGCLIMYIPDIHFIVSFSMAAVQGCPADAGFLRSKGAMLCSGIKKGILCYRWDYFIIPGSNACSTIPCEV